MVGEVCHSCQAYIFALGILTAIFLRRIVHPSAPRWRQLGQPMNTSNESAMQSTWAAVEAAVIAMPGGCDEDDSGMRDADDDQLRDWVDDQQDRVGNDVAQFRTAVEAYIAARAA